MQQLTDTIKDFAQSQSDSNKDHGLYRDLIDAVEAPYLKAMLPKFFGNQSALANALGINRATLRKKLVRHDLI